MAAMSPEVRGTAFSVLLGKLVWAKIWLNGIEKRRLQLTEL